MIRRLMSRWYDGAMILVFAWYAYRNKLTGRR